jgi:hypothetical protein
MRNLSFGNVCSSYAWKISQEDNRTRHHILYKRAKLIALPSLREFRVYSVGAIARVFALPIRKERLKSETSKNLGILQLQWLTPAFIHRPQTKNQTAVITDIIILRRLRRRPPLQVRKLKASILRKPHAQLIMRQDPPQKLSQQSKFGPPESSHKM